MGLPLVETGARGKNGGRRENMGGITSGVQGNDRGRKASIVAHKSSGVWEEERERKACGVAGNPGGGGGGCPRVGGGVGFPQDANTPRVARETGRTKHLEEPQRQRTDWGEDGRGQGMKTHPPPDQLVRKKPTTVKARQWAVSGQRSRRAQQKRRRTTVRCPAAAIQQRRWR